MKKPPLTAEDEAVLAKMLANREKRRQEQAAAGPRKPLPPGGTFDKKWQEPFLAGAFPDEPRPPTPTFTFPAEAAVARKLPPIVATIDALPSGLVPAEAVCADALFSMRGGSIAVHAIVGRGEEPVEQTLRRCALVGTDVVRTDTTRLAFAGVTTEGTCFTWRTADGPRACCAATIDIGGAPITIVLECSAGIMAKPTCAQVLATGALGDVAETLRLRLVGS